MRHAVFIISSHNGEGLIPQLVKGGHHVVLLSRGAERAAEEWPDQVEAYSADITSATDLTGAANNCDAVVHITGIVSETLPDITFENVNVKGTQNLLGEATRVGAPRFIYVSSLGADRGTSEYHASKRRAEALVQDYAGEWLILRPGNVYGPGDAVISQLLSMVRTLPAVPVVGDGNHAFQPIWYEDLGCAIAKALDLDRSRTVYELAGTETTTPNDLLDRFQTLTNRQSVRIPIPEFLARMGTRLADMAGVTLPINESQFLMLVEENVVHEPNGNALTAVFAVTPTPLAEGLRRLADVQPEQQPAEGVGGLERKRFWADITGSSFDAAALIEQFRQSCTDVMPIEFAAEPGAPQEVVEGATLTAAIPLRGNIQIRVEEIAADHVTFATLRGHPLAGVVRFDAVDLPDGAVRFAVNVFARAATVFDWVAMSTGGTVAQNSNWRTVVERVVELSGGDTTGVQQESEVLDENAAEEAESWIAELIAGRRRVEHEEKVAAL
ncbi:MAG TPA: DUF1990 family protein [Vicinamibacterales bacterium]|nr:DUF1990 family protein [Vicinamibacterales bacterium]